MEKQFGNFSNYGESVDLTAPGVNVPSTVPGGYGTKSGTSVSAPHVTGAAALLIGRMNSRVHPRLIETGLKEMGIRRNWSGDPDGMNEPMLYFRKQAQVLGSQLIFGDVGEDKEEDPGGFVCVSDQEENGDSGNSHLHPLTLFVPYVGDILHLKDTKVRLQIQSGSKYIKLWKTRNRKEEITSESWKLLEKPDQVYVEGVKESNKDRIVKLSMTVSNKLGRWKDQVSLSMGALQILGQGENKKKEVEELSVANWKNSYEENPPILKDEFIKHDPDRFFVRLRAPQLNNDRSRKEKIGVTIETNSPDIDYDGNDKDHDDDPTVIQLEETSTDSGMFLSESQMLVGDSVDDEGPEDDSNGIPPSAKIAGNDDQDQKPDLKHGDRTHIVGLGGEVLVSWPPSEPGCKKKAKVPVKKRIKRMKILIQRKRNGDPVTTMEEVKRDLAWTNERYAQAGVLIDIDPKFSNLNKGDVQAIKTSEDVREGGIDPGEEPNISEEQKVLFNNHGTERKDDLVVFYVNRFSDDRTIGQSIPECVFNTTDKGANNSIISEEENFKTSLAHELMHNLLCTEHKTVPPVRFVFHFTPPEEKQLDSVEFSRRIKEERIRKIRKSKFFQKK